MEQPQQPKQQKLFSRRVLLIAGGVVLFFALYLLIFLVPDAIQALSGPPTLTLAQAADVATAETTYAAIADGAWDCNTINYVRGPSSTNRLNIITRYTEAFRTDTKGGIVLLARMSGEMSCADLQAADLSGYLTRMSADTRQELTNEARLARFFEAEHFLEICGYCGETNSLIGAGIGTLVAVGGIALIVVGLRMPRRPPV